MASESLQLQSYFRATYSAGSISKSDLYAAGAKGMEVSAKVTHWSIRFRPVAKKTTSMLLILLVPE